MEEGVVENRILMSNDHSDLLSYEDFLKNN